MHKALSRVLSELSPEDVELEFNCPLSQLTSFRIGGPAAALALPKSEEGLCRLLALLDEAGIAHTVLGNGSNVLAPDEGYAGVIILTRKLHYFSISEQTITASTGASLSALCRAATRRGLAGFSALVGIPATLGGALFMNAGAGGRTIGERVRAVRAVPSVGGTPFTLSCGECLFGYRTSVFARRGLVILGAELTGEAGERVALLDEETRAVAHRRATQPLHLPSAGSVFRRPQGDYAGRLIEAAGLKGYAVGGAQVSPLHAGFIVNTGGATAHDVKELVRIITETVRERFGVSLVREIEYLGE
ncbi:MAG: UDP-N-acetylmuramate dehydrogenase [Clostridia bacterium]|nr:UDP-N-acetylmuramate dehydrogenase [Clostridia bacterium]